MSLPLSGTYPVYFDNYIKLVDAASITETIEKYSAQMNEFFINIKDEKADYRYEENKWSIKEVLQHLIDAERIFAFRALSLARGEKASLPGFEENEYANASEADNRSWKSLLDEFVACRKSTDLMLLSFTENQLQQSGITNSNTNTVVALAYVIVGHILHHMKVVEERYL
jgi:uncharacterized damage-inducible protein DinB